MYSGYFGTVRLAKLRGEKPKAKKKKKKKSDPKDRHVSRVYMCVFVYI